VNTIAVVLHGIGQTMLELAGDRFPRGVTFKGGRAEMRNGGNVCRGKYSEANVHEAILLAAAAGGEVWGPDTLYPACVSQATASSARFAASCSYRLENILTALKH